MDKLLCSKAKRNGSYLSEEAAATEAEFQRVYDDALSKLYELAAVDEQLQDELSQKREPTPHDDFDIPPFECEVQRHVFHDSTQGRKSEQFMHVHAFEVQHMKMPYWGISGWSVPTAGNRVTKD